MALSEIFNRVNELHEEINSFGKLNNDILNKINYKFRLDWNYHSNAMEGNSLTQQETRSVMINNVTIEGKPIKDVLEVKGHDEIISQILKIGKGELRLSEKRIQDIHKAIMYEDNPELSKKIGKWKTENNHLINYKGEKYEFVPHAEVAERMHELINWLNKHYDLIINKKEGILHPVALAFHFHVGYVSIHPFYDGNGRTARIFTNLILIAFGYPPVIIKKEDKEVYNQYLADIQAYGGDPSLFLEFMYKQLIHSQEIVLNAIAGKDIDEPDDLDKKLVLLEKELEAIDPDDEIKDRFNADVFFKMYDSWISDLLKKIIPVVQKFNKFFTGTRHDIYIIKEAHIIFIDEPAEETLEKLKIDIEKNKINTKSFDKGELIFSAFFGTFTKGGVKTFGCNYGFEIKFDYTTYSVEIDEFVEEGQKRKKIELKKRLLHKPLSPSEIDFVAKSLGDAIYKHIDYNTKKNGIR